MTARSGGRGNPYSLPRKLIRTYGTRDPFQLAEHLNIRVKFMDTRRQKAFCKKIMNHYFIFINQNLSEEMQRLSCAHELAHVLLHRDYLDTAAYLMNMELFDMRNRTEYEANLFAANLLIDDAELLEALREGKDIVSAAAAFDVNVNLMALKLAEMEKSGLPVNVPFVPERRFLGRIDDRPDAV
ncbi:MAG: ImmA/IrrE family metallo-endopeptidase [Oscillospiraceae bacterium]|nr:ImmA/IrrE family metallo-endopeptidase [Oscillospiraceae bacterium]